MKSTEIKLTKVNTADAETTFLCGLLQLPYGHGEIKKMKAVAQQIPWAQGWPEQREAFWNAEAFLWKQKIPKEKRQCISQELAFFTKNKKKNSQNKNLDLGCGAYSYFPSVGFDCSEKMLLFNEQCFEKVRGNLEDKLPFADAIFDSVTAIFVMNYVKNSALLLSEIWRVIKNKGNFVMVLGEKGIQQWQKQKEVHQLSEKKWISLLTAKNFRVTAYHKEGLLFFKAKIHK